MLSVPRIQPDPLSEFSKEEWPDFAPRRENLLLKNIFHIRVICWFLSRESVGEDDKLMMKLSVCLCLAIPLATA